MENLHVNDEMPQILHNYMYGLLLKICNALYIFINAFRIGKLILYIVINSLYRY